MSHCHCGRCRKAHGSAFATYAAGPAKSFVLHGKEHIAKYKGEVGGPRHFCRHCGAVVPGSAWGDLQFVPVGNFEEDPGSRPEFHIFTASKAPWYRITDDLPQFDGYPPGVEAPGLPNTAPLDPPGKPRGSCLCGGVAFVLESKPMGARYCHCTRCRRSRSAAHAANLFTDVEGVRFTRGEELIDEYKVPEAKFFKHAFCRVCGSYAPRKDTARGIAIV